MTSIEKFKVPVYAAHKPLGIYSLKAFKDLIEEEIKEVGPDAELQILEDDGDFSYRTLTYREETNAEINTRLAREKQRNEQNKLFRLNQYKKLKEEFGE